VGCTDPLRVDQAIRELLQGEPCEVEKGMQLLIRNHRKWLMRWTAQHFPSLQSQAEDICQETMLAVWKMGQSRKLSEGESLRSLLETIANRRGVDLLRSKLDLATIEDPSRLVDLRSDSDQRDREEIMQIIVQEIQRWPKNRRLVWKVYLRYFGELRSFQEIRQAVFCHTGRSLALSTVIRKIKEGRQRIRDVLSRLD